MKFLLFLENYSGFFVRYLFYIYICAVMWIGLEGCTQLLVCEAILFFSLARNFVPHSRSFVALSSYFIPLSHLFVLYLYTLYHDARITYRLNFCIRHSRDTSTKNMKSGIVKATV